MGLTGLGFGGGNLGRKVILNYRLCCRDQVGSAVEHLTRVGHEQNALLFAPFPCLWVNLLVVCIPKVSTPAAFFRNAGCQGHLDARRFNTCGRVIFACSLNVCAMGKNAARNILEAFPLLQKIIPHMVTYLVNELSMRIGYLGEMRCIDDDLASVSYSRLGFVHSFCSGP